MMRFIARFTRHVCVAAAACWWVAGSPALASQDFWKTAASGVWSVGSNWVDGSTPGNSDEAVFDRTGAYTVTFNGDPLAIQQLALINSANVTFTSSTFVQPSKLRVAASHDLGLELGSGATLTLGTSGGIFQPDKPLHLILDVVQGGVYPALVGNGASFNVNFGSQVFCNSVKFLAYGTLAITNGSLVSVSGADAVISAPPPTGSGAVTVSGAGSRWINLGTLEIGGQRHSPGYGNGSLLISGGGVVENSDARLGGLGNSSRPSSVGDVTVTGSGSIWKTSNRLELGFVVADYGGPGIINIQPGGTVAAGNEMVIGSEGRVRLQGGTLDAGTIQFSGSGQLEWTSGKLSVGVFHGHLGNYGDGVLAPGHSAGSTAITGNYEQSVSGALEIEVGGAAQAAQHDVVNVTGLAVLGGQLDLKLINGFAPSPSQTFIIMTAGSFSGAFANAATGQRVTISDGGGTFLVHYGAGSAFDPTLMVLSDFRAGIPGDFDDDGDVDRDDLLQWQGDFGVNGLSDADEDGDSDGVDFLTWQRQLGSIASSAASISSTAALPEPAAGAMALLSLVVLSARVPPRRLFLCPVP